MFAPSVVHIAPTPLVAAPLKVTRALNARGTPATCIILTDYPKDLAGKFVGEALLWSADRPELNRAIEDLIAAASIVHVHNALPTDVAFRVQQLAPSARYVYQVHSPLREGPLYVSRVEEMGLPFSARLVVGQYQPRHYPDYVPVPNIVDVSPSCRPRTPGERLRVLFSPTHQRGGRWNGKASPVLERALHALSSAGLIEAVVPKVPLPPHELMQLRRWTHVTIDEIVTGAFHQVSLEGLCAGNVVINAADYFSRAMLAQCAGVDLEPPFVYADESNVLDVLRELALDLERTAQIQRQSYEFFRAHLMPDRLVQIFIDVYRELLDADALKAA